MRFDCRAIAPVTLIAVCVLQGACLSTRAVTPARLSKQDTALLDKIQRTTFGTFWDAAEPLSGMARERSTSKDVVTTGGSGFGLLAILVACERGWIPRSQALDRLRQIVTFLEKADRFHGAWPHWLNGKTGKTTPFSPDDDGADLVETAFLMQGLLTVREFCRRDTREETALRASITHLWNGVEWKWFTNGGESLLWHWSPRVGFKKNMPIRGWNEALIVYVLAASSPTHPISAEVYHHGWARDGKIVNRQPYRGITLPLGKPTGGPLFFAHYSFLCLDPRGLRDRYADYWEQNVRHTLANFTYCVTDAPDAFGYDKACWGLTASDDPWGYLAHAPGKTDNGTITPTAALSSMPYAPDLCLQAGRTFDAKLGDRLWGPYGFYDAFNLKAGWFSKQYLAIDQGPIIAMIENYRTGLLWDTFMRCADVNEGLQRLGFERQPPGQKTGHAADDPRPSVPPLSDLDGESGCTPAETRYACLLPNGVYPCGHGALGGAFGFCFHEPAGGRFASRSEVVLKPYARPHGSARSNRKRLLMQTLISWKSAVLLYLFSLTAAFHATAAELKIAPPPGEGDAVPTLREAIAKCRAQGIRRLVLGQGTWNVFPDRAEGEYRHVTNHDDGYRRIALHLNGFSDFEIDGPGATILCHGVVTPLAVDSSTNITLRNFTIDWDKPFHLEGSVTAVGKDWFEVRMLPECEAEIRRGLLLGGIAEGLYGDERTARDARQDIRWNYWVDPTNKCAAPVQQWLSLWNETLKVFAETTKVGENVFRIRNAHRVLPQVGTVMVCKGMHRPNRLSPAIHLSSVDRVLVDNVTVHHAGGMGLIAEDCSDVTVRGFKVALKPGRQSLVTTTADATHFLGCRGTVVVESCLFENMLDDSCNVHGVYAIAEELLAPNQLAVSFSHFEQLGTTFARPGDRLALLQRDTLLGYAECTVSTIDRVNEDYYILTLDQPLVGGLRANSSVENLSAHPDFIYRKNTVRNNRARGILVTTAGRALIEDNDFVRPSMLCVLIEGDNHFWYESGAVKDVTIRRNRFTSLFPNEPVIRLSPHQPGEKRTLPPYHRNIRILDNTIDSAGPKIVTANRVGGLEFSGNTVTLPETAGAPPVAFTLTACEDVVLRGNTFNHPALVSNRSAEKPVKMEENVNLAGQ